MLLLPTILAGCDPSAEPLQISIPTTCDRFKKTVADPVDDPGTKAGDDAIALLAIYREKLKLANSRIIKDRECEQGVRKAFAAGK